MTDSIRNQALGSSLPTTRPTKTVTRPDGSPVTLVALPVMPPSGFHTIAGQDYRSNVTMYYDAAALITARAATKRRLPLDINHNIEKGKDDQRARGWDWGLTTAEHEPGLGLEPGLHAWFELNPLGAQELADMLYGYTSVGGMGRYTDKNKTTFVFTDVTSLALVNKPAAAMPMAFSAQSPEAVYTEQTTFAEDAMLEKIKSMLGLEAGADEAAVEAALSALQSSAQVAAQVEAGTFVAAETLSAVQAETVTLKEQSETLSVQLSAAQAELATTTMELSAAKEQLQALAAEAKERDCTAAVAEALSARKITPAQRDAMLAFARADLAAFRVAMGAAAEVLPGTAAPAASVALAAEKLTAEERAFCAAHGIKEASYLSAKNGNSTN